MERKRAGGETKNKVGGEVIYRKDEKGLWSSQTWALI